MEARHWTSSTLWQHQQCDVNSFCKNRHGGYNTGIVELAAWRMRHRHCIRSMVVKMKLFFKILMWARLCCAEYRCCSGQCYNLQQGFNSLIDDHEFTGTCDCQESPMAFFKLAATVLEPLFNGSSVPTSQQRAFKYEKLHFDSF